MKFNYNDIEKIDEFEDGTTLNEVEPPYDLEYGGEPEFTENLAETLSEDTLKRISTFLIEQIEQDIEASKPWSDSIARVKEVLGFDVEEVKYQPFPHATKTYDTTLATSLIRFYSTTRIEMLPPTGPVGFRISGESNDELENKGKRVSTWLNYYLTVLDKGYYADYEKFLLHLGFSGDAVRKTYVDRQLNLPISRFIMSDDFIIDGDCTSITDSHRLTHVLHLSKREILLNQQRGIYRDVELPCLKFGATNDNPLSPEKIFKKEDFDVNVYEKPSLFDIYECHVYLSLEDFDSDGKESEDNIPLPYIVTFEPKSKEILSLVRNWRENDPERERINCFVHYKYLPGFGPRGIGLAHLLGSNAISLTTILRELIDAGKFKNLPGGLRQKGIKQQDNDIIVGPGQFPQIDTGGIPIKDAFVQLPYSEPSQTLRELRLEVISATEKLGSTSEMGMMDSKEDIATGTAMAFLETNNRIQSAVLKSIHYSLTQELQLLDSLFRETLDDSFIQNIKGEIITPEDFADEVEVMPVSDPSVNGVVQRIMKAQAVMQLAAQDPSIHNMREVFKLNYKAQGLDEEAISKILLPDPGEQEQEIQPLDPVTENMNALNGQPVKAAIWQDHAAHKYVHAAFVDQLNKELYPNEVAAIMAHIKEHDTYEYLVNMQQLIGTELPPLEMLSNPEIQNQIALAVAQGIEESGATSGNETVDPATLLMADIQQRQEETEARERIAERKTESEAFKTQMGFEESKMKIESNEKIAALKSETELTKQGIIDNE